MAELVLDNVTKIYPGRVVAVHDLSLRAADAELVVIVGPSGCGKTTTLRMIAGLERPTSGTIRLGGRPVNDLAPGDRDVAMVFQEYALYPHMSVYDNLAFGLKLRRLERSEVDRRVREAAGLLGIELLLDRYPRSLSGGERQRVALGRAIVRGPQCFLLDEPLSNLDARLRTRMRAQLKALHRRLAITTVHVTHDQEEAMSLGDRVVVMSRGRAQQIGTPREVYRRPANRFVAGFVGTPPMSFVEGRLEGESGALWFADGQGVRLELGGGGQRMAAGAGGRPVVLGIRPEALGALPPPPPPEGARPETGTLRVDVVVTETVGDWTTVYGRTPGGAEIAARLPASGPIAEGATAAFRVEPGGIHLFEPGEYGRAILLGD